MSDRLDDSPSTDIFEVDNYDSNPLDLVSNAAIARILDGSVAELRLIDFDDDRTTFAATVERHEVIREPDQEKDIFEDYAKGSIVARAVLQRNLYGSRDYNAYSNRSFHYRVLGAIAEARSYLESYHDNSGNPVFTISDHQEWQLRKEAPWLAPTNYRNGDARIVQAIAARARDPYAARFKAENEGKRMSPQLDGIPEQLLPYDIYKVPGTEYDDRLEYKFVYPSGPYTHETYFRQADVIQDRIEWDRGSMRLGQIPRKALGHIADQYQLLACARPFSHVNNSMFMNLANLHIKSLGLRGIPHDNLDNVAHRLQPESFRRHFTRFVVLEQP